MADAHAGDPVATTRALALGVAAGSRTFTPPVAVVLARGGVEGRARTALLALAAGELVADKLPFAPSRLLPPALVGRAAAAAWSAGRVGGPPPVAAAAAVGGAFALRGLRHLATEKAGLANHRAGLLEDALCFALVAGATR